LASQVWAKGCELRRESCKNDGYRPAEAWQSTEGLDNLSPSGHHLVKISYSLYNGKDGVEVCVMLSDRAQMKSLIPHAPPNSSAASSPLFELSRLKLEQRERNQMSEFQMGDVGASQNATT
jgi:hypothetical protein